MPIYRLRFKNTLRPAEVRVTDKGIQVEKIDISYASVKEWAISGAPFSCTVIYADDRGRDKRIKFWGDALNEPLEALKLYSNIVRNAQRYGYQVKQRPDKKLIHFAKRLEGSGVQFEFVEPNVKQTWTGGRKGSWSWRRDLGGLRPMPTHLEKVCITEIGTGRIEYIQPGSSAFMRDVHYETDYIAVAEQPPQIACVGKPQKKFKFFRRVMIDYNWKGDRFAQKLTQDIQLREMLIKANAPAIKVKTNLYIPSGEDIALPEALSVY